MALHCASTDENSPECLTRPKRFGHEAYLYGWGPNEYVPTGSLGDFEYIDRLGEIHCPCLLFSGTEDLCTPAVARSMYEGIPGSRWELMEGARHMCFVDRHEDYCRILESWLEEHDR
jgi:proline iminopeptidase